MLLVVCGCLASVGSRFSTLSAHPDLPPPAAGSTLTPRARARRRDDGDPTGGEVAASYARYSSDQQDASSIDQQQRKCRDNAAANGHDLRPELEFADEAVSGTRPDRAGLQAMLAAARDRRFGVLYFESLSRLAREFVLTVPMLKELVYVHKVRVISTSEGVDSAQAGWELMAIFRSWMHGEFLAALRAAVLRGQEDAVLNDYSVGDWCLGYASEPVLGSMAGRRGRNAKPRKRVVVREDHARWVRQVFDWFVAERRSLVWIARELTRQGAPKDHRSTTPEWRPEYVAGLLRNRKYVGVWPWGVRTNVRNPLTGQVRQENRPPAEAARYERERPHLRLVDDDTFFKAQGLLDENEAKVRAVRGSDGRLRGWTKNLRQPCHLLQGLITCGACGSGFRVAGADGKYLGCGGYRTGKCSVRTKLRRDRAGRLILGVVGDRILRNAVWHREVLEEARSTWEARRAACPDELTEVIRRLAVVEQRIARLVDAVEAGEAGPEVHDRLAARRRERDELVGRKKFLEREASGTTAPPTADWVAERIGALGEVLSGTDPAAAVALRDLLGPVVVTEAGADGRKRRFLRGTFTLRAAPAFAAAGPPPDASAAPAGEAVTVDFADPPPWAAVADRVKELYDAGVRYADVAARLGCPRSWPAKALAYWHRERGLTPPDGRATRDRLAGPTGAGRLVDRAEPGAA